VPINRELTFYVRHGELFAKVCAAFSALVVALLVLQPLFRAQRQL
jgi:hypothetical protein